MKELEKKEKRKGYKQKRKERARKNGKKRK